MPKTPEGEMKEGLEELIGYAKKRQQEYLGRAEAYRRAVRIWRERHGEKAVP
jgi:hypothetical protein